MMQRMAETARSIQDEHLNSEAIAEMRKEKDVLGQLDEVQRLLAQGKVDEAMAALQKLGMQMDEMQDRLDKAAKGQTENDPALQKLSQDLQEYEKKLDDLAQGQKKLADDTEAVKRQYRQEMQKQLQKNGAEALESLRHKIEKAQEQLAKIPAADVPPRATDDLGGAQERLKDLANSLAVKDLDAALESAARALSHAEGLEETLKNESTYAERFGYADPEKMRAAAERAAKASPLVKEVKEQLEKMFPDPSRNMSAQQRQQLRRMAEQQAQLQQQMQQLQQKADQIGEQAPIFDEGAKSSMQGAQQSMQDAEGRLRGTDPGGALASQRAAGEKLQQLKDGLEQARQRAQQNKGGSGFPMPMASSDGEGDGDGRGMQRDEKVAIPSADAYKVPEEFRKDILDAMKQNAPESFKEQVKSYYEEIVK
jgi:DNA repair ATPase RecN